MKQRHLLLALLIALLIITQTSCGSTNNAVESSNYFLDTSCKISIYETDGSGVDQDKASAAMDDAWDLCRKLEKTISKTIESSDVSKINKAGGNWVEVSDSTIELLKKSIEYSELSDGVFDVTIGSITSLWDFQALEPKLPAQEDLDEAVTHVNYRNIQIDGNRVRLADPSAQLDLGGIAKGYIGDKMAELLEKKGVTAGIVNLGGNVIAIGSKPDAEGFNIGIEKPFSDRTELIGSKLVSDKTLVTSGVYERQFEYEGKKYHHILSVASGYPVETDLDSVTLVAEKGRSVDIDAMSTICLILGSEKGKAFIEAQDGVEALFCLSNGEIITTSGMEYNPE